ncbi:Fungal specific transcription factor domain [Ceratobasidium sp. AG-Ba]|nr:Fungal specific transcription factor domain [Ceratobasidium sp. AG-Ba]
MSEAQTETALTCELVEMRPCTTCVKSHRFAAVNNPSLLEREPECTYDELLDDGTPVVKPRTKYQVLEDRIVELEAMLKAQSVQQSTLSPADTQASIGTSVTSESGFSTTSISELPEDEITQYNPVVSDPLGMSQPILTPQLLEQAPPLPEQQLIWPDWPCRLPQPSLLYHLVEVFFSCYPHAHYLLHRPTFMASLALPPRSPRFPHASVLHAICAYAGMFSYLVDSPPMPDLGTYRGDVIFGDRRRTPKTAFDSFADRHARWAKEAREEAHELGFNLLECTQSVVISTGYYYLQGRWVELWMAGGMVIRYCIPLALNNRPGYDTDGTPPSPLDDTNLLAIPTNCVEREQRVNLFWTAYANDRFMITPSVWAMGLDDEDVHQDLPYNVSYYEAGQDVKEPRQTIRTPNVLLVHPQCIDSFTLFVKAAILLSRVKSFNIRIRHQCPDVMDIRCLPRFAELEQQISAFRASFPSQYKDPIVQSSRGLDTHLYVAHLIPGFAKLLLHEKLVQPSPNCVSAHKAVEAAREILELVYAVCSTSYDITRLLPICAFSWYKAASFLTGVLRFHLAAGNHAAATRTDSEIRTIRFAFSRMAQRIPLALRFLKMLDDESKGDMIQSQSVQTAYYDHTHESHQFAGYDTTGARCEPDWSAIQPNSTHGLGHPDLSVEVSAFSAALGPSEEFEQMFQFDPFSTLGQ